MELQIARQIIDTLAQGIHPVTGEAMPEDSPYNASPVIRALHAVSRALDGPSNDMVAVPRMKLHRAAEALAALDPDIAAAALEAVTSKARGPRLHSQSRSRT